MFIRSFKPKAMNRDNRGKDQLMTRRNNVELSEATGRAKLFITFLLAIFSSALLAQGTAGIVDISVKTIDYGKGNDPEHILAIWIEDDAGDFVKTLKLSADERKKYLYTWNTKSSGNTTDANTGATLGSHTTHDVSWNCTNTSATVVDDGAYAVWVEYTSEHAQGPITNFAFTKASDVFSFQPPDESYFVDMDLLYTPESASGIRKSTISYDLKAYPNPASDQLNISLSNPLDRQTSIRIYQSDMKMINVLWDDVLRAGEHGFTWNLNSTSGTKVAAGTYFMVVSGDNLLSTRQIIVK